MVAYTVYGKPDYTLTGSFLSIDPGITSMGIYLGDGIRAKLFEIVRLPDDETVYSELSGYLDRLQPYLGETRIVIIERQMKTNYRMVRLSQHIITYLLCMFQGITVFEINPRLKTTFHPDFKTLNTATIKKMMSGVACAMLRSVGDEMSATKIEAAKTQKAKSDLADAYVQAQALFKELVAMA